jgi:hypothetical protein
MFDTEAESGLSEIVIRSNQCRRANQGPLMVATTGTNLLNAGVFDRVGILNLALRVFELR